MRAKEYLNYIRTLDTRIEEINKSISDLRSKATSIRSSGDYQKDMVQGSGYPEDEIARTVAKINEYELKCNKILDEYIDKKVEAIEIMGRMESGLYIKLLSLRYFEGLDWKSVAERLCFSIPHTYKLHGWALLEFQKAMDKR